jgi:hypothetical protein
MKSIPFWAVLFVLRFGCNSAVVSSDTASPATSAYATAEIRKWTDGRLRAEVEKADLGREDERLLLEIVRRGGHEWQDFLAARYDALMRFIESPSAKDSPMEAVGRWWRSNLHLLTALRRLQSKPDPLRILVAGKLDVSYSLHQKPQFTLLITNLDEAKQTVTGFTDGGHDRSGRLARWRFEIRDQNGRMLPIRTPFGFMGGGIYTRATLKYFESWSTTLRLRDYVDVPAPGRYSLRVFYHNEVEIDGSADINDRITSRSEEMTFEVTRLRISLSDKMRQEAREWISQLPDAGPVKMAIGIIEQKAFLDPDSAPGQLQRMYTSAVPDLIDAALDPKLTTGQRAWVLGLLFAITGHNDPRDMEHFFAGSAILGSFEYIGDGTGSRPGGQIDVKKQRAFAEKWRVWKTNGYYSIETRS